MRELPSGQVAMGELLRRLALLRGYEAVLGATRDPLVAVSLLQAVAMEAASAASDARALVEGVTTAAGASGARPSSSAASGSPSWSSPSPSPSSPSSAGSSGVAWYER